MGAYLITWACYGAWLPGKEGAIPRTNNRFGSRLPQANAYMERHSRQRMPQPAYSLDDTRRQAALNSIVQVCSYRQWRLLAAHIRTNHVHVVVTADRSPERVMNAMKAYASRTLNDSLESGAAVKRWARHGSTRYLWTRDEIQAAVHYVVRRQGVAMAVFEQSSAAELRQ